MKGILWYVTRKLEGIFDGILMEFCMRISEDKNQIKKSMYIPRFLSSGLYGRPTCRERPALKHCVHILLCNNIGVGVFFPATTTPRSFFCDRQFATQFILLLFIFSFGLQGFFSIPGNTLLLYV